MRDDAFGTECDPALEYGLEHELAPVLEPEGKALPSGNGPGHAGAEPFILELDGFEGPLDLLLMLARTQKVDLTAISILHLVDQYLAYINRARQLRPAADYLVMAAWLAALKSRLLLAREEEEEPSAEELALRLRRRLQRLKAMREAGARLMARERLGRDLFLRGAPEGLATHLQSRYQVTLYELLRAYGAVRQKAFLSPITLKRHPIFTPEDALRRLESLIGRAVDWSDLVSFLPTALRNRQLIRSAIASYFAASLELAKSARADLRQDRAFAPVQLRRRVDDGPPDNGPPDDGPANDGPPDDGPPDDGPPDDGPPDDGPANDGPPDDGPANDGPPDNGPANDGPANDGPAVNHPPLEKQP